MTIHTHEHQYKEDLMKRGRYGSDDGKIMNFIVYMERH